MLVIVVFLLPLGMGKALLFYLKLGGNGLESDEWP